VTFADARDVRNLTYQLTSRPQPPPNRTLPRTVRRIVTGPSSIGGHAGGWQCSARVQVGEYDRRTEDSQHDEPLLRHFRCTPRHPAVVSRGRGGDMTALHDTDLAPIPVPIPVLVRPDRPQLKAVIARVATSLATAVVAPAALFAATLVVINVYAAVSVALAWMVAAMCWRGATKRPVSGLLVLTLGIMTIKTVFTLVTGNTFVYFVQPVFADATVAAIFLASLWTARPIVARIAPDFYPVDAALAARPRVRQLFRRLTLLWGLVLVVKGGVTLWLLLSLSTVNFVLIKGSAILTLTLVATVATVALSAIVGRQEGLLRARRRSALGVSGCRRPER
jgi:hypothetical protein